MTQTLRAPMVFPRITGIILAAGFSRRAAPHNKLLLPAGKGIPVVRRVAAAFCAAGLDEVIVVTGHQGAEMAQALAGLPLRTVPAPDFAQGMGHSLAAGIRAARPDCRGFLVSPGDLPGLHAGLVREVAQAFEGFQGRKNIVPAQQGIPGHPVALVAELRPQLEALTGDRGAKVLLGTPAEAVRTHRLAVSDAAVHTDNDHG